MDKGLPEEVNRWKIYAHPCFKQVYDALVREVEVLKQKDSEGYQKKASEKLLAVVHKVTYDSKADSYRVFESA